MNEGQRLERVDELRAPPIVGVAYLVPMVWAEWGVFKKKRFWPVLGRLHEDAAIIKFPYDHYHLDTRFLGKRFWSRECRHAAASPLQTNDRGMNSSGLPAQPLYRRAICKRVECGFAAPWWREKDPLFFALAEAFAELRCLGEPGAWICPHREMPLGSLPVEDGIITCPLHGLRWRADTGCAA